MLLLYYKRRKRKSKGTVLRTDVKREKISSCTDKIFKQSFTELYKTKSYDVRVGTNLTNDTEMNLKNDTES